MAPPARPLGEMADETVRAGRLHAERCLEWLKRPQKAVFEPSEIVQQWPGVIISARFFAASAIGSRFFAAFLRVSCVNAAPFRVFGADTHDLTGSRKP